MKIENVLPHIRLKFNIEYPTLEECWSEGYEASQQGLGEDANPYKSLSIENQHWNDGWWAHFYDEAPVFDTTAPLLAGDIIAVDQAQKREAANEDFEQQDFRNWATKVAKIAGAIAATALLSYQLLDIVA